MATALIHLRNAQEVLPKVLLSKTKDNLGRTKYITKGNRPKVLFQRRTKEQPRSNLRIPMYTKVYTHVYTGRDKEFYANPEWRAKADAIKASRKKTLANFINGG